MVHDPDFTEQPLVSSLEDRLQLCAKKAGGKRALAKAIGVSEAQLFRYLRGVAEPNAGKISAIANVSEVDPSWLLTGNESMPDDQLIYDEKLFTAAQLAFERACQENQRPIPLDQKAEIFNILFQDLLREQNRLKRPPHIGHLNMLFKVRYLSQFNADTLQRYKQFVQSYPNHGMHRTQLDSLINSMIRSTQSCFTGVSGEILYDQRGYNMPPELINSLKQRVEYAVNTLKTSQLNWLDIGCGNGRDISFISRHYENIQTTGLDLSPLAQQILTTQQQAGLLPNSTFIHSDMRFPPLAAESMDVVYARVALGHIPYVKEPELGLNQVISQIARILKPGGIFYWIDRYGDSIEYTYFQQLLNRPKVREILTQHKLTLENFEHNLDAVQNQPDKNDPTGPLNKFNDRFTVVARKLS